jgi:sugar/nucleoside kinase (ribokinase family)
MDTDKITIAGTGCALADFIYTDIEFGSPGFMKYLSGKDSDGGLCPGKLIFTEELEKYAGLPFQQILKNIVGSRGPDAFNLGGPSLVSLVHAGQLLGTGKYEVRYYGMAGNDETSDRIFKALSKTPVNIKNYKKLDGGTTPSTFVFSDPSYNGGNGERSFVNNIGAAWGYTPDMLGESFFKADIVCFGGTALTPHIHDNLTALLKKAKANNCVTLVNTVYDFRNEKINPGRPWPLVDSNSYGLIDVLVMNDEEALKISGKETLDGAAGFFISTGVSSFIITNGASDVVAYSSGGFFGKTGHPLRMPISDSIRDELKKIPAGQRDTTGCGDNFAGGVIASLAWQLSKLPIGELDLVEAVSWGIVSGGFACSIIGGTWFEKSPGEKLSLVSPYFEEYGKQLRDGK